MFNSIRIDIKRFQLASIDCFTEKLYFYIFTYGLHALVIYRFGRWLLSLAGKPLLWPFLLLLTPIYLILYIYIRVAYDIHLDLSSSIGPGLYIGHFGGIKVVKSRIGLHCSIQQEVRLVPTGAGLLGPKIGNRVWIGAHVQILGNLSIDDGATIGAGALVKEHVKAGNLVAGNPARILSVNYDNSKIL